MRQSHGLILVDRNVARRRERRERLAGPRARAAAPTIPAMAASTRPSTTCRRIRRHAARAERRADDEVALPLERPRDHQVGDVGARDEQHERDHGDEDRGHRRQELRDARVGPRAVLGDDQDARALVLGGIRRRQALRHDLQLRARVRQRLARARDGPSAGTSARRGCRATSSPPCISVPMAPAGPSR